MFASSKVKGSSASNINKEEPDIIDRESRDERQHFLIGANKGKARLARQETIEGEEKERRPVSCAGSMFNFIKQKRVIVPIVIILCIAAIYCMPYIEIEPRIPKLLPHIPFNFREGPLAASSASQFKIQRLFLDQIHGPESVALDSTGNMYLAIEGGFILYAHLNKSSPLKKPYYDQTARFTRDSTTTNEPEVDLIKIAELNAIKQLPSDYKRRPRDGQSDSSWRRECQLDEKVYGPKLYSGGLVQSNPSNPNDVKADDQKAKKFVSNVAVSRCSKPLGIRLSPDESYLYVIDTLSGLYRISLKVSEKAQSTQRLVTKLIDFQKKKGYRYLPVTQFDLSPTSLEQYKEHGVPKWSGDYMNVSLLAVDDLVIEYGAGLKNTDIIYLTVGSQGWQATSFIYDMLEGRPTGVVLRYDAGPNLLSVINPSRIAHVRTSSPDKTNHLPATYEVNPQISLQTYYLGIGAPKLDENDFFDDRPLHFPNGIELTDNKEALLIADTVNKRIIKHYIRGDRVGTSDLWAWTPNFPDNIRRGYDKQRETYWVVGCGEDTTDKIDIFGWLHSWPKLRKYILKNIYLFGWFIEVVGSHVLASTSVRDFGYSVKMGNSLCENFCTGMMILQYNKYGDLIRSIYSNEFPNDMRYYSQVNEIIDANNQEHILYLSSPSYRYITKLTLPTESFDLSLKNDVR